MFVESSNRKKKCKKSPTELKLVDGLKVSIMKKINEAGAFIPKKLRDLDLSKVAAQCPIWSGPTSYVRYR